MILYTQLVFNRYQLVNKKDTHTHPRPTCSHSDSWEGERKHTHLTPVGPETTYWDRDSDPIWAEFLDLVMLKVQFRKLRLIFVIFKMLKAYDTACYDWVR